MARDFNGSTGYLVRTSSPVTGYPFTMAGWVKFDTAAAAQSAFSIDTGGVTAERFVFGHNGGGASVKFRCFASQSGGSAGIAVGATTVSTGTWYHVAAVFRSTTDRELYVNGVSDATNTTSITPTIGDLNRTRIGATATTISGVLQFWDGPLAEMAIYDADLSAIPGALPALAANTNPLRAAARPIAHIPVYGANDPEFDMVSTATYALTGTANQTAHPPVAPPFFAQGWMPSAAGTPPVAEAYFWSRIAGGMGGGPPPRRLIA